MTKVFIAGSRQIARLPAEVKNRIDTMVDKGFQILVGDANGADKAVQRYLAPPAAPRHGDHDSYSGRVRRRLDNVHTFAAGPRRPRHRSHLTVNANPAPGVIAARFRLRENGLRSVGWVAAGSPRTAVARRRH